MSIDDTVLTIGLAVAFVACFLAGAYLTMWFNNHYLSKDTFEKVLERQDAERHAMREDITKRLDRLTSRFDQFLTGAVHKG